MKYLLSIFILTSTGSLLSAAVRDTVEIPLYQTTQTTHRSQAVQDEMPTLDMDAHEEEHQELLDHFEAPEMSPFMEWLTMAGSEVVAGMTRFKRAFLAYLLKVKQYVTS